MSPRQVYQCPVHGEFEEIIPFSQRAPPTAPCPAIYDATEQDFDALEPCDMASPWVPSAPNFIGGPTTGAKPPSLPEE